MSEGGKNAGYVRISEDPDGDLLGVTRQRTECSELAARLGIVVDEWYEDDDRSAYNGKPRPAYLRLMADVAAGRVSTILAQHPDRINRSPRELEDLIDILDAHTVNVHTYRAGVYDLSTASGRMQARIVGAVARHESEQKSERQKSKARQLAEMGLVGGGGPRPFGYEKDRVTIVPGEAAVVVQMAQWILDGSTVGSIVRRLNAGSVSPVAGGVWPPSTVRRILLRPRYAGLREHRGVIVGKAVWPAILDEATWRAVVEILQQPARRTNWHPRPYLFTGGLARCGACGRALIARPNSAGERCYICPTPSNIPAGCGKIRRKAEPVEQEVLQRLTAVLADLPDVEPEPEPAHAAGDLEAARLEETMAGLARDHYALNLIGRVEYLAARDALARQLSGVRAGLHARPRRKPVRPADLPALWEQLDHEGRRQFLADWIDAVVIHPALKGRNTFDPTKIEVRWRQ